MRHFIILMGCLLALNMLSTAQKKVNRQFFINLLNAGDYSTAFKTAIQLRAEVYGKNAVLDYFIAKTLCLDGHKTQSATCFDHIINDFKLTGNKKDFIVKEKTTCNAPPSTAEALHTAAPDYGYINNVSLPESSIGGKMGRVFDCFSKNQTINVDSMVTQEELESRLFGISQKKEAYKKISSITRNLYKIDTVGRYVFVTPKQVKQGDISVTTAMLERAYQFYLSYYQLRAPDKLITVYILPDQETLRQTALLVHGIKLPDPNIGYSNLSDLSLLGIGDFNSLGTMYHELFHLIVRTDVGDIPAFLDEGIACLYAVSAWDNNILKGDYRPWRLAELQAASVARDPFLKIPPLAKLINDSWSEFDGQDTKNVCQVAVNYALSNFLMIYLQEKDLLQPMVTAFKNRPFIPDDTTVVKSNVQIFETVVNDSIAGYANKFYKWFANKYNFNLVNGQAPTPLATNEKIESMLRAERELLDLVNEKVYQYRNQVAIKALRDELNNIELDYRTTPGTNEPAANDVPQNTVQQNMVESPAASKRRIAQSKLEAYDKKLRKLLFDSQPKTAN